MSYDLISKLQTSKNTYDLKNTKKILFFPMTFKVTSDHDIRFKHTHTHTPQNTSKIMI